MIGVLKKYFEWIFPLLFIVILFLQFIFNAPFLTTTVLLVLLLIIGSFLLLFHKNIFFSLCIFLVPLSVDFAGIVGANLSSPAEPMVILLALTAILIPLSKPTYLKKILFHPISILLLLDLLWLLIASFYSEMYMYSIKRVVARFSFLIVFYLIAAHWITKKEKFIQFFLLYSLGLLIPIFLTGYKHQQYNFNPQTVYELSLPFYAEHTIYGACIAFLIPFLLIFAVNAKLFNLSIKASIFLWVLFIVFITAEILTFSRAAWMSLGACFLMYLFLKLKLKFWHFLVILISIVLLFLKFSEPLYQMAKKNTNHSAKGEIGEHIMSVGNLNSDASNLERINRWLCAYRMYEDRPITGFGPGTYQFVYGPYQSIYEMTYISTNAGDKGNAHSEPLTYLAETGLPGFISYFIWSIAVIGYGIGAYLRAKDKIIKNIVLAALLGFITFFTHGFVNSFIDQVKLASLVFGSIAIIVVADLATKSKIRHVSENN